MICRYMHWSYADLLATPVGVLIELIGMMQEEAAEQERERAARELNAEH